MTTEQKLDEAERLILELSQCLEKLANDIINIDPVIEETYRDTLVQLTIDAQALKDEA